MQTVQTSQISPKYQTSIPSSIRKILGVKAGDRIEWRVIISGKTKFAIAHPTYRNWTKTTRGIDRFLFQNVDVDSYIDTLRNEWNRKK